VNWTAGTYLVYLLISVPLTITLSRNGRVFLSDVFGDDGALADAVNSLLVVGFYLLNLGFVILYLRSDGSVVDLTGVFEALSQKIGVVMLVLGGLHFFNIFVFNSIRRRTRAESLRVPPLPPQDYAAPRYPAPGHVAPGYPNPA